MNSSPASPDEGASLCDAFLSCCGTWENNFDSKFAPCSPASGAVCFRGENQSRFFSFNCAAVMQRMWLHQPSVQTATFTGSSSCICTWGRWRLSLWKGGRARLCRCGPGTWHRWLQFKEWEMWVWEGRKFNVGPPGACDPSLSSTVQSTQAVSTFWELVSVQGPEMGAMTARNRTFTKADW